VRGDTDLIAALHAGDEAAFTELVDTYSPALLRVALGYVPSRAVAEEVVQETWLAVVRGLDSFEGRSSLKTWIFRILVNLAMKSGGRERRSVSFTALPTVPADRFLPDDHPEWAGHWAVPPVVWPTPEEGLLTGETRDVIIGALDGLPPAQRDVIALRDIAGWESDEVCEALSISAANQRVLLHRARSRVRAVLEEYFESGDGRER
jgi:RNA polymerase sigma-70 factor (ECF subfamily)